MYEGYKPRFYVSCNAADNAYYFTGVFFDVFKIK